MLFSKLGVESTVVTFSSTAEAFAFERACKNASLEGRLITIPRQLSAGCGMAWASPVHLRDEIESLAKAKALVHEGVHTVRL